MSDWLRPWDCEDSHPVWYWVSAYCFAALPLPLFILIGWWWR